MPVTSCRPIPTVGGGATGRCSVRAEDRTRLPPAPAAGTVANLRHTALRLPRELSLAAAAAGAAAHLSGNALGLRHEHRELSALDELLDQRAAIRVDELAHLGARKNITYSDQPASPHPCSQPTTCPAAAGREARSASGGPGSRFAFKHMTRAPASRPYQRRADMKHYDLI